jgi:hypothetical protein
MTTHDEEKKGLLRRIVESLAWRQLASINMLGHCLKYVPELDTKLAVAAELDLALGLFREVRSLYRELGWTDLESAVRDRLGDIPYPGSRLEFGVAYYVTGQAEYVAMDAYTSSSYPEFAAIARSYADAATRRPEPARFLEFAADPTNRPQAQQYLNHWLEISRRSFGRPGTVAGARAVELGLRSKSSADMDAEFRGKLEPFLKRASLQWPELLEIAQDQP